MSLSIASIASGSNGNCYYIQDHRDAVLIDAGISCRETVKRMARLGLKLDKVRAVFISHEHTDHICGLEVLMRKFRLPVFITTGTQKNSNLRLEEPLVNRFRAEEKFSFGQLQVTPFSKFHDAKDPHSFIIESNNVKVGVLTDIGKSCDRVVHYFKQCHAAFLESNYDEDMLFNGSYPYHLKKRISDGFGHLSNSQALQLFLEHRQKHMTHLVLSHLSGNNNKPSIVNDLFTRHANGVNITVASRHSETELLHINAKGAIPLKLSRPEQLTMF